jgi:hypothetical protein
MNLITVGGGRGFVVLGNGRRYVITAAHCLPFLPPPCSFAHPEEQTYKDLLAPLGQTPRVWAECMFVDPIADVAVLGPPDNQSLGERANAYEALVDSVSPFTISGVPVEATASLISLAGEMISCVVRHSGGPLWISKLSHSIQGGMSGSPILAPNGWAIGVCVSGNGEEDDPTDSEDGIISESGPEPCLIHHLPGWLLREAWDAVAQQEKVIRLQDRAPKRDEESDDLVDIDETSNVTQFRSKDGSVILKAGFNSREEAEAYWHKNYPQKSPYLKSLDGIPFGDIKRLADYVSKAEYENWLQQDRTSYEYTWHIWYSALTVQYWLQPKTDSPQPGSA